LGDVKAAAIELARGIAVVEIEQVAGQFTLHEQRVADRGGLRLVEREAKLSATHV